MFVNSLIVVMEQKRAAVVHLHLAGMRPCDIVRTLASTDVKRRFVFRTLKHYRETGGIRRKPGSGRKVTATTEANANKLKYRLRYAPRRSARKLAKN